MNRSGTKIPIPVKVYMSLRTFNLLLDFVEANVPIHVDVYLLKRFVKILEY